MKILALFTVVVFILTVLPAASRQQQGGGEAEDRIPEYWTCGMHPSVRESGPGKCPICFMGLVPVYGEEAAPTGGPAEEGDIEIRISPAAARLARIRTAEARRRDLSRVIRATAVIEYDETRTAMIAARFGGRVERLFADFTGKRIAVGEKLASIYSPELVSAQREYLLARGSSLSAAAGRKLSLWGMTGSQIEALEERGDVGENVDIHSPAGGTIIHRYIAEGSYVSEGDPMFHISDISRVWVVADVFENAIGLISEGMEARVECEAFPGESWTGNISFIEPYLDRDTRSVKVRVEIDNTDEALKPGMYAVAEIRVPIAGEAEDKEMDMYMGAADGATVSAHEGHGAGKIEGKGVLSVPASSVIDTGTRTVVFVEKEEGVYVLRRVVTGPRAQGFYVVLEGLAEGERVVERGSFLIDSQASLTGMAEEVYGGALGKESEKAGHRH